MKLDLGEVIASVRKQFKVRVKSRLAVVFDYKDYEVSLFNGGRILIKNVSDEESALRVYKEISKKLGIGE